MTSDKSLPDVGPAGWRHSDRYRILGRLGEGAMGCVYEAFDRNRRERVAIKALKNFEAGGLYKLKQEFRALADVRHPNLVHLHELVAAENDDVFFSMELVEGTDFLEYVCGRRAEGVSSDCRFVAPALDGDKGTPGMRNQELAQHQKRPSSAADYGRLRAVLVQIVEGVAALHSAGKLHRDLKPSNVLVTDDGRVVVLDFGVATELRTQRRTTGTGDTEFAGTAAYVAPEQVLGEPPVAASDWYSLGVMLYEAIVGEPPFVGTLMEVMTTKCTREPPAPSASVEGVPPVLDALCRDLLAIGPVDRPTAAQIADRISSRRSDQPLSRPWAVSQSTSLIGRERQLAQLREALGATRQGHAVSVRIVGTSGMGKSAIAERFLDELEGSENILVLRGRAYERESVPYKAVDALIDALSRHLLNLEVREEDLALPAEIAALAQVFPVLRSVSSIEQAAKINVDDPSLLRQRAFRALRAVFAALADRGRVVIFIDDVHWGDVDSAALLRELLRPPGEPALLVLTTHRAEQADTSAFLAELAARWPDDAELREIAVDALEPSDAQRLAMELLQERGESSDHVARAVADESGGSPFLIGELVRSDMSGASTSQAALLDRMVGERMARLPDTARRLFELVALAGRPLPMRTIREASEVQDVNTALALLQASRLVHVGLRGGIEVVETTHDRIREVVVSRLSEETAHRHHTRLARVLELTPDANPDAIAMHLLGAGARERAAHYAQRAAELAVEKLAFDQAAGLFQLAIDSLPSTSTELKTLRLRVAQASEWAGHSERAARAYLAAATYAAPGERLNLERAAAAQLIAAGRIDEGAASFRRILAALSIAVPRSWFGVWFWTWAYRVAGTLLLYLSTPSRGETPAAKRAYLSTLHTMGRVLSVVDPILASYLKARYLCAALAAGAPYFILRAAILEAGSIGAAGGNETRKERKLYAIARQLAEAGDEEGLGQYDLTYGIGQYLRGRWRSCVEYLDRAQVRLVAVRAWQANASIYRLYSMVWLGDLTDVKARAKALLADAERRGDRYTMANILASHPMGAWLASDDVQWVQRQLKGAIANWSETFVVQHWQCMIWQTEVHLYVGEGEQAWLRLVADEQRLARSSLRRIHLIRASTYFARGRSAVASLRGLDDRGRSARLRSALRAHRRLERERMPWTDVLSAMLYAAIANARSDATAAQRALRQAIALADLVEMPLHGAVTRHRLGLLVGGATGAALVERAAEELRARGVRVPERYTQMLLPGEWTSDPKP